MKKSTKLERSLRAHYRLNGFYLDRGESDKNRVYANYHAECFNRQKQNNKVLSKQERQKIFKWWCKAEGYTPKK